MGRLALAAKSKMNGNACTFNFRMDDHPNHKSCKCGAFAFSKAIRRADWFKRFWIKECAPPPISRNHIPHHTTKEMPHEFCKRHARYVLRIFKRIRKKKMTRCDPQNRFNLLCVTIGQQGRDIGYPAIRIAIEHWRAATRCIPSQRWLVRQMQAGQLFHTRRQTHFSATALVEVRTTVRLQDAVGSTEIARKILAIRAMADNAITLSRARFNQCASYRSAGTRKVQRCDRHMPPLAAPAR